jgi:hypothetical protein
VTSFRQWAANRENAQKSTGPRTEEGKRRSRRNALRHGLTAQTVIAGLEDSEDYRAFEASLIADYDARTAVERELVLRLASLLWRIRRATGIETDLLRIQAEILRDRHNTGPAVADTDHSLQNIAYRVLQFIPRTLPEHSGDGADGEQGQSADEPTAAPHGLTQPSVNRSRELTICFLRLANLDNEVFERLGRYEATLWRQVAQTLFALQPLRDRRSY